MRKVLILIACLPFFNAQVHAQNFGTLTGFVINKKTGQPIPFATVKLEGTTIGARTDTNGIYTLKNIHPQTYNVNASSIGYTEDTKFGVVIRSEGNADLNFET